MSWHCRKKNCIPGLNPSQKEDTPPHTHTRTFPNLQNNLLHANLGALFPITGKVRGQQGLKSPRTAMLQ